MQHGTTMNNTNCCYKVWILYKNCDLRINQCLCHFDLLQKTAKNSLKMAQSDTETCQSYSEKVISLHTVCINCW